MWILWPPGRRKRMITVRLYTREAGQWSPSETLTATLDEMDADLTSHQLRYSSGLVYWIPSRGQPAVYLHREIARRKLGHSGTPAGPWVTFADGNRLNFTRANVGYTTPAGKSGRGMITVSGGKTR